MTGRRIKKKDTVNGSTQFWGMREKNQLDDKLTNSLSKKAISFVPLEALVSNTADG